MGLPDWRVDSSIRLSVGCPTTTDEIEQAAGRIASYIRTTPCLQLEPGALQHVPDTLRVLLASGLLPARFIAIILNLALSHELADEAIEEVSGGMAGHKHDEHV